MSDPIALPGLPLSINGDIPGEETIKNQEDQWAAKTPKETESPADHFGRWLIRQKGGKGSGNRGHKGIPGQRGGSAPGNGPTVQPTSGNTGESTITPTAPNPGGQNKVVGEPIVKYGSGEFKRKFDAKRFAGLNVPDRIAEWRNLSEDERDEQADAVHSVPSNQAKILSSAGSRPAFSGDVKRDIATRLNASKHLSMPESHERIKAVTDQADSVLEKIGVDPKTRYELGMEMADALVAQEYESMTRQLGDHGIHHIQGNIENSLMILSKVPGNHSDREAASIYISQIFHDSGYMTEPSRMFLDEGHKRWSAEHYDTNLRPLVEKALGARNAGNITHIIRTHDDSSLDWESDPVASSIRVADNMSLFHKEKLPALFRVKGNLSTLIQLHQGKIDEATARQTMLQNVSASTHTPQVKEALNKACGEVTKLTGKFTLGMLGGYIDSAEWTGGHVVVNLRRNKNQDLLNKILDLGQAQFGKFAKSYKVDPAHFLGNLNFKFPPDGEGQTVLEGRIIGIKEKRALRILYGQNKNLH